MGDPKARSSSDALMSQTKGHTRSTARFQKQKGLEHYQSLDETVTY